MFYMIQKNMFKEHNYDEIIHHLARMGLDYEIVRMIPFIGEIEFTTDRKDVFCFGAVKLAHVAEKYGFNPGSMYNDNHDFLVYGPKYGENMLNHGALIMNFSDPLPEDDRWTMFFARPTKDTKVFSGQVYMRHSWDEYVTECKKNDATHHIEDETQVMISPLKNIQQEIRCFAIIAVFKNKLQWTIKNIMIDLSQQENY